MASTKIQEITPNGLYVVGELSEEEICEIAASKQFKSWLFLCDLDEPTPAPEEQCIPHEITYARSPIQPGNFNAEITESTLSILSDMHRPVLLHCRSGARAAIIAISAHARQNGFTPDQALEFLEQKYPPAASRDPLKQWLARSVSSVPVNIPIVFRQLFEPETCTYTYLLADPETKEAIIIDPVLETVRRDSEVVNDLELNLIYGLNTHVHADHITGTGKLKEFIPAMKSVIASYSEARADVQVSHGDRVRFGRHILDVRSTPGHTNGCLSYVLLTTEPKMAFTGDALLIRGCGRTDFQQGDSSRLYDGIHAHLFTLPDDTLVYPAHDYKGRTVSTIGEEKRLNPRLTKTKEEFIKIMSELGLPPPAKLDVSVPANMVCGLY